ncbi:hypothetical protein UCRPC4_g02132 [Phaeomoniella chlamydospora]|uniref:Uncharacterized protein n=1 Tax=Phaeomoniella chlamydospora TaxID=158046 RepID=A0A0G2H8X4_PHACM|nr:hypothetical protein UCRPC4_g02132 [Phaeomoniella chlamydospora]
MGAIRDAWLKWKSLKLPWRKKFLIGQDLQGHTYWELKDTLNAQRMRRMVKYRRSTQYSEVKVSPQWHQWLRHTRIDPPSLQEQQADVMRQAQMKQLARVADERWASKPSFLDKPRAQPAPATMPKDPRAFAPQTALNEKQGVRDAIEGPEKKRQADTKKNPWQQPRGVPGEGWQPEAWTPGAVKR